MSNMDVLTIKAVVGSNMFPDFFGSLGGLDGGNLEIFKDNFIFWAATRF